MKIKASILTRIALLLLASLFLSSVLVFLFSYNYLLDSAAKQSRDISVAANTAALTAIGSEEALHDLYEDEEFREKVHQSFRFICKRVTLRYLYLYTIEDDGMRHYIICAANDDEDDHLLQTEFGFGSISHTAIHNAEKKVMDRSMDEAFELINNEYGWVCMTITPIVDSENRIIALIGADDSIEDVKNIAMLHLINILIISIIVFILSYIIALLLIRKYVTRPIVTLSERMGNFASDRKVNIETNKRKKKYQDEITDIENVFEKMTVDINSYVSDIETLTSERIYTQTQLEVAMKIQSGIVPREYTLSGDHFEIYGTMIPARSVGGDFYDVFRLDNGNIGIVAGDISDKGISAALFMTMVKTTIREKMKAGRSLADTLNLVNRELCVSNPGNMFATVFALILDPETGIVTYANAGHEAPLLLGKSPSYLNIRKNIAIGLFEDSDIVEEKLVLHDGDGILLYTDGITEAINIDKQQYGRDRLRETVIRKYGNDIHFYDARELADDAVSDVFAYTSGMEQFDDITCLAVIYKDTDNDTLLLSPDIRAFNTIKSTLLLCMGKDDQAKKVLLACEEIFANIVAHSGADKISFNYKLCPDTLLITFTDNGTAFDPVAADQSNLKFEQLDNGGMGIIFARANSREMIYNRINDNNVLTMVFDTEAHAVSE